MLKGLFQIKADRLKLMENEMDFIYQNYNYVSIKIIYLLIIIGRYKKDSVINSIYIYYNFLTYKFGYEYILFMTQSKRSGK